MFSCMLDPADDRTTRADCSGFRELNLFVAQDLYIYCLFYCLHNNPTKVPCTYTVIINLYDLSTYSAIIIYNRIVI